MNINHKSDFPEDGRLNIRKKLVLMKLRYRVKYSKKEKYSKKKNYKTFEDFGHCKWYMAIQFLIIEFFTPNHF